MTTFLNDVALTGKVAGLKYDPKEHVMHFSVRNSDGTFHIKVYDLENIRLCEQMTENQQVNVLGELRSFVNHKTCRSHHVYIRAKTIIPFDESPALKQLITLVGIQALYDAKNKNGHSGAD